MTPLRHFDRELAYGAFLFAVIGNDDKGPLSVISALARLDIEPWDEATMLAQLPRHTAARRLALLLDRVPTDIAACKDPQTSIRLVALLPHSPLSNAISPMLASRGAMMALSWLVMITIIILIAFVAERINHQHQPPMPADRNHRQPARSTSIPSFQQKKP